MKTVAEKGGEQGEANEGGGTVLRCRQLKKEFGETPVLRAVSMDVGIGEFVCVWGPSGAGKSTLLHVLGLMTPPSGGELDVFGRSMTGATDSERTGLRREKIGFLFQFHHLLPDLTLLQNVMMPLLIRRCFWEEAEHQARQLLDRLGLSHRLNHHPSEASGGEQQRTALARALIGNPRLLLADEPTGNLDRGHGRDVEKILQNEVRSRRISLILVTHNEGLASQADRRVHLVDGQILSD